MNLQKLFNPVIGVSYCNEPDYYEISPHDDLKSYIRCFWGYDYKKKESSLQSMDGDLVIPDACSDIIFQYFEEDNCFLSSFCEITDKPMLPSKRSRVPTFMFGIRFYGWGVSAFSADSLKKIDMVMDEVEEYFPKLTSVVQNAVYEKLSVTQIICLVEEYLRHRYQEHHINSNVISSVGDLILSYGGESIDQIASRNLISRRQLERDFKEYIGITPKKMAGIVRYQLLWQEILTTKQLNISNMLDKYQYTDQAHMLNDFKKHHGMNWKEALFIIENEIAFLQEIYC